MFWFGHFLLLFLGTLKFGAFMSFPYVFTLDRAWKASPEPTVFSDRVLDHVMGYAIKSMPPTFLKVIDGQRSGPSTEQSFTTTVFSPQVHKKAAWSVWYCRLSHE